MVERPPNIIFLMDDQRRWDGLGLHRPEIITPHLDALAQTGVCFRQAVCQCPMCIPSRNSLMYGLYPSQLGVRSNAYGINREDIPGLIPLPRRLQEAGYQTVGFGKTHWSHGWDNPAPSRRGFDQRWIGQANDVEAFETDAILMGASDPEALDIYDKEVADFGPGEEDAPGYLGLTSRIPIDCHRDSWICAQAERWLESYNDTSSDHPLFFYLSFMKPHAGYNVPPEFEQQYCLEDIPDLPTPPWEIDDEASTHVSARREEGFLCDRTKATREVWQALSPQERRRSTLRYFANMTFIDSLFGRAIKALEKAGALEHALMVYLSDHGEMMGERHHRFSKYCLYDSSVRVPLILSGSTLSQALRGRVDDRLVELVDVLPTLCAVAGYKPDPSLPGVDLLRPFDRKGAFSELHGSGRETNQIAPALMWRNQEWKLIVCLDGSLPEPNTAGTVAAQGELYHLESDPHEWNNLYNDSEFFAVRESMTRELLLHLALSNARYPKWGSPN